MDLEFATAQRIVFGRGKLDLIGELAVCYGTRAFVVAGDHLRGSPEQRRVDHLLAKRGVRAEWLFTHGEPEVEGVDEASSRARSSGAELVIALGGGSALDVGKAAAGLAPNGGSVREYLEGVGTGRSLKRPGLPCLAVPTTAGTGSEVTRNAVVSSKREGFKKSIRSPLLLPAVALVDPALTDSLPAGTTASSGLDALIQMLEPYVSLRANAVTDALALEGLMLAARSLPRAFRDGSDAGARDEMALASLLGGLCLANAGLGAVHGIAAALGARFEVPHGTACASVLVATVEANLKALASRLPSSPALHRYGRLGLVVADSRALDPAQAQKALVARLRELTAELKVPRLRDFGVAEAQIATLVRESRGSSMKTNPVELNDDEIGSILHASR